MCLLLTSTSANLRNTMLNTQGLLRDIYTSNQDGLGAMYAQDGQLVVTKILPSSAEEVIRFFESLPDDSREIAVHFRMRTHGDIDMDNCHPYKVTDCTWLMHNGILHTGNKDDTTKSDTWHFIKNYFAGMPVDALHAPGTVRLIEDFIRDNRFAIMSADGRLTVVNREQGIEHGGVWFSNEYAWTPEMLIPNYRSTSGYGGWWPGHMRNYGSWSEDDQGSLASLASDTGYLEELPVIVGEAVYDCDTEILKECLNDYPAETVKLILDSYDITPYRRVRDDELTQNARTDRHLWLKAERDTLVELCESTWSGPQDLAEALLWTCDLASKSKHADNDEASNEELRAAYAG